MTRSSTGFVLGTWALAFGILAACGKVANEDVDPSVPEDGGGPDTAASRPSLDASLADAPYVELDGVTRTDASQPVADVSSCSSHTPCDCDEDGFAALDCTVDAGSIVTPRGTPLQPGDCDDLDPLRFPGQRFVAEPPPPGQDGDWNCNQVVEFFAVKPPTCEALGPDDCFAPPHFIKASSASCGELDELWACTPTPAAPNGCAAVVVGVARHPCK